MDKNFDIKSTKIILALTILVAILIIVAMSFVYYDNKQSNTKVDSNDSSMCTNNNC